MAAMAAPSDEVVAGNVYPKYTTRNPLARLLVANFTAHLRQLAARTEARELHEVGCGEGFLAGLLAADGYRVRGSDLSPAAIAEARRRSAGIAPPPAFQAADLYRLEPERDAAELVVCCEVLEHLPDAARAVEVLGRLARPHLIASVPKEPLWRILNLARGKYWSDRGNTPGHLQHWSGAAFVALLARRFDVVEVRHPLPWTMVLCRARSR
ncbi:MAG TPA: class I SAM-dependent methyltransferase [Geminicoccaceae bacterium]|nr:class I SAM-dependent methyltransferase [Geminicoccaceae bacterium]